MSTKQHNEKVSGGGCGCGGHGGCGCGGKCGENCKCKKKQQPAPEVLNLPGTFTANVRIYPKPEGVNTPAVVPTYDSLRNQALKAIQEAGFTTEWVPNSDAILADGEKHTDKHYYIVRSFIADSVSVKIDNKTHTYAVFGVAIFVRKDGSDEWFNAATEAKYTDPNDLHEVVVNLTGVSGQFHVKCKAEDRYYKISKA